MGVVIAVVLASYSSSLIFEGKKLGLGLGVMHSLSGPAFLVELLDMIYIRNMKVIDLG